MSEAELIKENPEAEETIQKWVYLFEEGSGDEKSLLGGKGAGLSEMTQAGLPVPPGFVVTTEACNAFFVTPRTLCWSQCARVQRSRCPG